MTEQTWLERVKAWEDSGLAQKAYCKERGVSYSRFCVWRSKLIEQGLVERKVPSRQAQDKPTFIPVSLEPTQAIQQRSMIEIQLPQGIVLRIPC